MRNMASLLLALLALMRAVSASDGYTAIRALELAAGMGGDDTHSQNNIIRVSTHLRSHSMRGTRGARIADRRSVVQTLRWQLPSSRIHLTSATTAQQQHHASVAACSCTLLHSCVHAMRALTWSVAAALPLCDARQFEFVRQRQALRLRNRDSLAARIAITIVFQQQ